MGTATSGKFATVACTATASVLLFTSGVQKPQLWQHEIDNATYENRNYRDWETYAGTPYYKGEHEVSKNLHAVYSFGANLIENSHDIDPEIASAIKRNFSKLF